MKKIHVLWLLLDTVLLALFNVFFFLLGGSGGNTSVWFSYAFILLAYVLLFLTPFITKKGKRNTIFGVTIYTISTGYFIAALAAGIVLIILKLDNWQLTAAIQAILAGLYVIVYLAMLIAGELKPQEKGATPEKSDFVKKALAALKPLPGRAKEKDVRKKLEGVCAALKASPVKSLPELRQAEDGILASVGELAAALEAGDKIKLFALAEHITTALAERNAGLEPPAEPPAE
jgi:MFS family permease